MTVLELKEALKDADDSLEVIIDLGEDIARAEEARVKVWSMTTKRKFEIVAIIEQ